MTRTSSADHEFHKAQLRLGLFGDTRSGKTVYLTALYWSAKHGNLPESVTGVRPVNNESVKFLAERLTLIESQQWPAGNIASNEIHLLIDRRSDVLGVKTADFRGGDFGKAFFDGNKADAEQFVAQLFGGCSAYIFFIDPGGINPPNLSRLSLDDRLDAERRMGGVLPALELLRRRSARMTLFHPPVAIVFTKSDQHAEAAADPDAYARQHTRPIWDYLRRHAPGQHRFFAASSTGPLEGSRPSSPLNPVGILDPILWCADRHRYRLGLARKVIVAVVAILLCTAYGMLFFQDRGEIRAQRDALKQADDNELLEMYKVAKERLGWTRFVLTHPWDRVSVLDAIVNRACAPLGKEIDSREDADGNLRTAEDWVHVRKVVQEFSRSYPGTEQLSRFEAYLYHQQEKLAARTVENLRSAATRGDEPKFDQLQLEYDRLAARRFDAAVADARKKLDEKRSKDAVEVLWHTVQWGPKDHNGLPDVDAVRSQCSAAEEVLKRRKHGPREEQFVSIVRATYEDLKARGFQRNLSVRIEGKTNDKLWWFLKTGDFLGQAPNWIVPVKAQNDRFRALGPDFTIDLQEPARTIEGKLARRNWGPNGEAEFGSTVEVIADKLEQDFALPPMTHGDEIYYLIFTDKSGGVSGYFANRKKMQDLADDLFNKKSR